MIARATPAVAVEAEPLVATVTVAARVMVRRARVSIRHMNHLWASRNRESAAMCLLRCWLNRALKTSSLPNPLMMVTPDMEEVMWWMTGDFSMLSSFLASRMPEFMVKSSSRKSRKMITKPTRK